MILLMTLCGVLVSLANSSPILPAYNLVSPGLSAPVFHSGANPTIIAAPQPTESVAHGAVVENAIAESQLPQDLLNPFYKNPAIAAGLAKESWFTNKEFPVHHREAEKIPRSQIYKLISQLHDRRR
ncbi:hypothetical protein TcasGA2_TC011237 [Tribolium castaneum]|uniref:Uncharacterized protein n=1 Tax=Tribolium castaneum TaxID=7070 RepID=D6X3G5_TRICA|nr:PREDICTED: uncharacterized protein LOC103314384 [Tribolium castaneum]EEZ97408.1 hypothetical protein TcasGA2_TC011237 [Tribolium castaneum]|eukprot:XP_008198556.1 PREDICTED: uncharacterized protein LOC103314384 [Tribolium castaneum]